MKPALHRSITFWAGILVMAFIVWAWVDSVSAQTEPMWESCMLESHTSALTFTYRPSGRRPGWECFRNLDYYKPSFSLFPPPHFIRGGPEHADPKTRELYATKYDPLKTLQESNAMDMAYRTDRDWLLCIPYWLILVTFALLWLALLHWRARRRRRVTASP